MITMYLLRRKSDGKYWRNRSSMKYTYRPEHWEAEWIEDQNQCRPFKTAKAAESSRGYQGYAWEQLRRKGRMVAAWMAQAYAATIIDVIPVSVKVSLK